MRPIKLTIALLFAAALYALAFAPDVHAIGHGRASAGCSGAYGGYSGWYPGRALFGFHRRQARRAARHAAYGYGCEGEAAASYGCEGAPPASCSEPAPPQNQYVPETVTPTSYQAPTPQVRQPTGRWVNQRVCQNGVCRTVRVFVP